MFDAVIMRVLVLAQYFPPDMGGGATRAYNVAKGLMLNGCKLTVIAAFLHYLTGNTPEVTDGNLSKWNISSFSQPFFTVHLKVNLQP